MRGIYRFGSQTGNHNRHSRGPTGISTDVVSSIRLICPATVQLVIIRDLRCSISEDDTLVRRAHGGEFCHGKHLIHAITQEYGQVLRVVTGQQFLFVTQSKYMVLEVCLTVIQDFVNTDCNRHLLGLIGLRINLSIYISRFIGISEGIQLILICTEDGFHIRQ